MTRWKERGKETNRRYGKTKRWNWTFIWLLFDVILRFIFEVYELHCRLETLLRSKVTAVSYEWVQRGLLHSKCSEHHTVIDRKSQWKVSSARVSFFLSEKLQLPSVENLHLSNKQRRTKGECLQEKHQSTFWIRNLVWVTDSETQSRSVWL